ncbi:MAG: leucine-rich repeat domain-containing protein [Oscillospiraceae bacterium]|nr:leucine-rich repeat domain-containing protein [Oscillospiraceae bacterium]
MKKIISITALLLLLVSVFTLSGCVGGLTDDGTEKITFKIENGEAVVKEFPDASSVTEVTVPDEYEGVPVTKVADFAAVNLENIETIYIGKNVKEIGLWAFENNQKLKEFKVDPENEYFCDVDGVLFTKDMKTLLFYPLSKGLVTVAETGEQIMEYTVPDGVETIRTKAFYRCQSLTSLKLPQSIKSIEEKAFFRCSALGEITLPQNLEFIGKDAFAYCGTLKEISIPKSVRQIDEYAFYNCTGIKTVAVENKESEITLGKKWYPTNNGQEMSDLSIVWAD